MAWWYNILTNKVEEGPGAPNSDRLGPYETQAEAENALGKVHERNEAWEAQNAQWDGDNE